MADLTVADIDALLSRFEPADVTGFVPVRALRQLSKVLSENAELRAALGQLVEAKNEKDANGDTALYRELKCGAWERARSVLGRKS